MQCAPHRFSTAGAHLGSCSRLTVPATPVCRVIASVGRGGIASADVVVGAGVDTPRGLPRFTSTFTSSSVDTVHPHHQGDQARNNGQTDTKNQDCRHETPPTCADTVKKPTPVWAPAPYRSARHLWVRVHMVVATLSI
jgi:hypothetical protein